MVPQVWSRRKSAPNTPRAPTEIAHVFLISIFGKPLILLRCVRPVTPEVAGSSPVSLAIFAPFYGRAVRGFGVVATITTMHQHVPDRVDDVAEAMGLSSGEEIETSLRQLLDRLHLPASLRDMGYQPADINELARAAAVSHFNETSRYRPSEDEYARMLRNILA